MIIGDAGIEIRPDASGLPDAVEDSATPGLKRSAARMAAIFTAAFAVVGGVGKLLGDAVGNATDLGENLSKVSVVFGDQAAAIEEFASTASTALGQSQNQALEAAGTFGSLFVGMGIGQEQAAGMSTSMVTLASDMASFGNSTPQEALDALRAGLIGEAEPLRRFGVMLDAAKIEAEALRLGLMTAGGEITEAAKAQAVYSLAMAQTSLQQGDFERTSAGLANQQRIMAAQWTDLSTNIGGLFVPLLGEAAAGLTGGLMPALLRGTSGLADLGNALARIPELFGVGFVDGALSVNKATEGVEGAGFAVLQFAGFLGDLSSIMVGVYNGADASGQFAAGSFQQLAAVVGYVASEVRAALVPAFETIGAVVGPALAQVSEAFSGAFGDGGGGGIMATVSSVLTTVGPLIADYIGRWADVIAAVVPIIADVFSALAPVIADLVGTVGPLLQSLLPVVSQVAGVIATTLVSVLGSLGPVLPPLVAAIGEVASVLAGGLLQVVQQLAPILPQLVQAIASVAVALADALGGALQAIIPVLPPLIDALIQLVLAALTPLLPILPMIAGLIGGLIASLAPLLPAIAGVVAQLVSLALQAIRPLLPLLPMIATLALLIVQSFAPFIPLVVQIVGLLVELAIAAILPLMPVIGVLIGMFVRIVEVAMPIITIVLQLVAVFMAFANNVRSAVLGFVGEVLGSLGGLLGFFVSLPGRILGALVGFGGLLFGLGADLMQGLVNGIASMASFVGGVARNVVNAIIGFVNDNLIGKLNNLLEFEVAGITINPPDVPRIPRLHSGGYYESGSPRGEGFALLRDGELVVTPEQQASARIVSGTTGPAPAGAAAAAAGAGVYMPISVTQLPGESGTALAAAVSQRVVWNLSHGVTRTVPTAGAPT